MKTPTTTFTVLVTVAGEPKEAHAKLEKVFGGFLSPVIAFTTETYQDANGDEHDTAELLS